MLIVGISTPLLGMVDTAVVGHLSDPIYLGAIAIGAMIFNFLYWGLGFLRMGTTGLVAKAIGSSQNADIFLVLHRGLGLALVLGILLILVQPLLSFVIFSFIEISEEVRKHAEIYFDIRIWSAPATLMNYVLLGWFLGRSRPKRNVIIVVSLNLLNIILDILFVVFMDMNSSGVALATTLAEYFGLVIGLIFVTRDYPKAFLNIRPKTVFDIEESKQYLKVNFHVMLRTIFLLSSFAIFTLQSAKFGDLILAANVILMNLQTFMAYVLDSIAHAVEVLVGRYFHGNRREKLNNIIWISGWWSLFVATGFALLYWLFGKYIVLMLTDIEAVYQLAMAFLPWLVLSPLVSVWSYWLDGIFIGANLMKQMRDTMLISLFLFIVLWQLLLPLGNNGLWIALLLFMLIRGITMYFVAYRKIFKPNRVNE